MTAADAGEGQVDNGLSGITHELKFLGRRQATPRLDLPALDGGGGVEGQHSRPGRAVADSHGAIISNRAEPVPLAPG
jgi:hypothetical protein